MAKKRKLTEDTDWGQTLQGMFVPDAYTCTVITPQTTLVLIDRSSQEKAGPLDWYLSQLGDA